MVVEKFKDKAILITGVCGTVGREILHQIKQYDIRSIIGFDINESEIFFLAGENRDDPRVQLYLGDLRNRDTLDERCRGIDIILHTAAYKHVEICERAPRDAVLTNILGTQNLIDAAFAAGVERVLFTSTDKAVNPTNVMGTSKLMAERLMTASTGGEGGQGPILASTRFGNVLGSRGSVLPVFRQQIERGGPVRLTHCDMSRFIMTLDEAVHLVLSSVFLAHGGEVFVTKMPAVRVEDLASVMIEVLAPRSGFRAEDVGIEVTGTRPGEKMFEELFNDEEVRRSLETDDYYVIIPALMHTNGSLKELYPNIRSLHADEPYNSALVEPMSRDGLKAYLLDRHLLD